jgi:hypothetical protein
MRKDALIGFFIVNNVGLEGLNLKSSRFVVGLPSFQTRILSASLRSASTCSLLFSPSIQHGRPG